MNLQKPNLQQGECMSDKLINPFQELASDDLDSETLEHLPRLPTEHILPPHVPRLPTEENAVVLLSGGLDSVTCLYWAKARYNKVTAISFNYGQRHNSELQTAIANAKRAKVDHRIIDVDIAQLGGSSLTDKTINVPTDNKDVGKEDDIPNTYVPARNTIFLSYAMAVAEVTQANHIVIGVSSVDYSGYPDCRPEYIDAFATMANLATKAGVSGNTLHIQTPLQQLSKAETIRLGIFLGVDYAQTTSCYQADEDGLACGMCDSCRLRKQGFKEAKIKDPTRYKPKKLLEAFFA